MRLYGAIEKVEAQSDGTVRVYGIAASEAVDEQGEIVRAAAMRAAIPDYMRFPALREMHQLSAAGTTLEAEVGEDGTTRIVAHVVDPVAVAKVKNQVYRGFSIGGRVTQRDAGNPKAITGLVLNEISLVDRPANPEAVFDCWKAAAVIAAVLGDAERSEAAEERQVSALPEPAQRSFNSPIQIWACGVPEHRHLAKNDAAKCLQKRSNAPNEKPIAVRATTDAAEKSASATGNGTNSSDSVTDPSGIAYADPGFQPDGEKRYPIDTERHIRGAWHFINKPGNAKRYTADQLANVKAAIIAAWKDKIDKDGPPSAQDRQKTTRAAVTKALWDVCSLVRVGADLEWLGDTCELALNVENDDSLRQLRVCENIAELRSSLNALAQHEAGILLDDGEIDVRQIMSEMPGMLSIAAGASAPARFAALLEKGTSKMRELATALLKRGSHSQADQALLDLAYLACEKCLETGDLSPDGIEHMQRARDHLLNAGAVPYSTAPYAAAEDDGGSTASALGLARCAVKKAFVIVAEALSKGGRAQQHMMDMAHDCLRELTEGAICKPAGKFRTRHSMETMVDLEIAHRHLVGAGSRCGAVGAVFARSQSGTDGAVDDGGSTGELLKLATTEHAETLALSKVVGEIMPMLEQLTRRVDEIARTPLPPLAMAKNSVSVAKQQDHNGYPVGNGPGFSSDAIAAALAEMSKEEQTLTLIKASHANPIRIIRPLADE